jgi:uncharacterized coiled-coil DUF342 family protein
MPEERWEKIQNTLDYVATLQRSHDEQIGKLVEHGDRNERHIGELTIRMDKLTERMDKLTERTIQAMDAINRLANIAANHDDRISDLENPSR